MYPTVIEGKTNKTIQKTKKLMSTKNTITTSKKSNYLQYYDIKLTYNNKYTQYH